MFRVCLCIAILGATTSSLFAVQIFESFNTGLPDGFIDFATDDFWRVEEIDGQLNISKDADDVVSPWTSAGISSEFALVGDFDIEVDFGLVTFPRPNPPHLIESLFAVRNTFPPIGVSPTQGGQVLRFWFGNSLVELSIVTAGGPAERSDLQEGRYRLEREGGTLRAYIAPQNGNYHFIGETDGMTDPMYVLLYGAQGTNVLPGRARSEMEIWFDNLHIVADAIGIRGDVNFDGGVDALDIDWLRKNIGGNPAVFDLNGDGFTTPTDVTYLVETILGTKIGDANTDREINLNDFSALKAHFGLTEDVGWGKGDFDGNGIVGLDDFGLLKSNFGFAGEGVAVVPEPTTLGLAVFAISGIAFLRRGSAAAT
jgi:hypothetical protein